MKHDHQTSFGFQKVSPRDKTTQVDEVFKRVARRYDLMNDVMSLGIHRLWKRKFIDMVRPRPAMHLLDVAGGTGDIALQVLKLCPQAVVTVCDRNKRMMEEGRSKSIDAGITRHLEWVCGDAAALPFADASFDAYTISFGLRNVTYLEAALQEAWRVLRPGGQFFCLEFSKVQNPLLRRVYSEYSFKLIPKLGALIAQDQDAYQYLVESIERFPDQEALGVLLQAAGFQQVFYKNLTDGVVAIHTGIKV